ncbi:hypothetical protein BD289DRAFT_450282 [Coniella lustricola]|uniref:Atos-like conserved domain-containing protein n=1 Tax=Coniella lustricola TaxID=2025994 RepID=A0A2T3AJH4_9PEZI|nr:hypothetical protein BD289DRAFT_450282 [Coniella lustricola]
MPFFSEPLDHDGIADSSTTTLCPSVPEPQVLVSRPLPILHQQPRHRTSDESIRTDLCDGPIATSLASSPSAASAIARDMRVTATESDPAASHPATSNRAELIERLKRGESPTWIPNRKHDGAFPIRGSRDLSPSTPSNQESRSQQGRDLERPRSALHSGDFTQHQQHAPGAPRRGQAVVESRNSTSSSVKTAPEARSAPLGPPPPPSASSSSHPTQPWFATSPPRNYMPPGSDAQVAFPDFFAPPDYRSSPPSLCSSLSASFVFKHPTSPLVQSESNDDEKDVSLNAMKLDPCPASSPQRIVPRRQTLHTLRSSHNTLTSLPMPLSAQKIPTAATIRRENTVPYQAHQPRRSLTSVPTAVWSAQVSASEPHKTVTPYAISSSSSTRRLSLAFDSYSSSLSSSSSSPLLQRTSMVGSYEESILRGRMSTTPSKPLDFLAQIGVLGLGGNCKSSLRCPAHVTLPFHAVFYSYSASGAGIGSSAIGATDDGPSPYVGMIDLENGLTPPVDRDEARHPPRRRSGRRGSAGRRSRAGSVAEDGDVKMSGVDKIPDTKMTSQPMPDARDIAKHHRRQRTGGSSFSASNMPKAPPGGSYRIPEKGQLQIIIKNQNKTAVKLFLVPYDLAGMEPGTKTFIRQRVYTGGSCVNSNNKTSLSSSSSGRAASVAPADEKPILRYLVHLHICSPARGRFYLYKSIRVVFASRVPDDKERLRNEITLPEPRFTPYKAVRVMHPPVTAAPPHQPQHTQHHTYPHPHHLQHSNTPSTNLAAEMAFRRSTSGFSFGSQVGIAHRPAPKASSGVEASPYTSRSYCSSSSASMTMSDAYALELRQWRAAATKAAKDRAAGPAETSAKEERASASSLPSSLASAGAANERLSSVAVSSEGLLTQRLRSLGMGTGFGMRVQSEWRGSGIEDEMVVSPGWLADGAMMKDGEGDR